jgi:hypothetical protein
LVYSLTHGLIVWVVLRDKQSNVWAPNIESLALGFDSNFWLSHFEPLIENKVKILSLNKL